MPVGDLHGWIARSGCLSVDDDLLQGVHTHALTHLDGPGIRNGIPASLETNFRIDTRDAGNENPEVLIKVNEMLLLPTTFDRHAGVHL